jgi:signal peptidase I
MLAALLNQLGLSHLSPRRTAQQILNFALILSTAFMLWKSLSVLTNSPSPIVVVLSGSMEPAFQRGDLLFLWNRGGLGEEMGATAGSGIAESVWGNRRTRVGEIVVYNVRGKDIPIVHRVIRTFPKFDAKSGYVRLSVAGFGCCLVLIGCYTY